MKKTELINYLNSYLNLDINWWDSSQNWLQVDTSKKEINKIGYAVDATTYIIDKALEANVDMIIVHHWIFRNKNENLVWIQYERIKKLFNKNIWLYACHLPLDAHKHVWNNVMTLKKMCQFLWVKNFKILDYFSIEWNNIWWKIIFEQTIKIEDIIVGLQNVWRNTYLYNFWNKKEIRSIWLVTWCWWSILKKMDKVWYVDLFLTWEALHDSITFAKENKQSFVVWWHYETEIIWVQTLSEFLHKKYWIKTVFLDEKY